MPVTSTSNRVHHAYDATWRRNEDGDVFVITEALGQFSTFRLKGAAADFWMRIDGESTFHEISVKMMDDGTLKKTDVPEMRELFKSMRKNDLVRFEE